MSNTAFFITQAVQRYEQDCRGALVKLDQAQTMWDVKRAAHVVAPSILRGMHIPRAGGRQQLMQAAERKLQSLLDAQLEKARSLPDAETRKAYLGQLRLKDWEALRGEFARLHRKADMEGRRIVAMK